jgi:hypothetical protein
MKRKSVLEEPLPPTETTPLDVWCCAAYERLQALSEKYGLDPRGPAFDAAFAIARDYVPGFQVRRKSGPRASLDQGARDLILCMELARAELEEWPGGVETAAHDLAARWQARGKKVTGRSLATRYYEIKKKGITPAMKRAAKVLAPEVQPISAQE